MCCGLLAVGRVVENNAVPTVFPELASHGCWLPVPTVTAVHGCWLPVPTVTAVHGCWLPVPTVTAVLPVAPRPAVEGLESPSNATDVRWQGPSCFQGPLKQTLELGFVDVCGILDRLEAYAP
jgi:hypothetical protein